MITLQMWLRSFRSFNHLLMAKINMKLNSRLFLRRCLIEETIIDQPLKAPCEDSDIIRKP